MYRLLLLGLLTLPLLSQAEGTYKATPLHQDGIHDKNSPALNIKQDPREALDGMPTRPNGTINWVKAYEMGLYKPRADINGTEKMTSVNLDIILENTSGMPAVLFSHKVHTTFLTCANCHTEIFIPKKGSNFISMNSIMDGQHCGVCHGAVAFGIKDCTQCHNVSKHAKGLKK